MGGLGNAGGAGAMFTGAQEMEGQMGGGMGGPMANVIQGALGGGVPGMAQKRTKMGKVHKSLSKLSKRKEIKKHQHKNWKRITPENAGRGDLVGMERTARKNLIQISMDSNITFKSCQL